MAVQLEKKRTGPSQADVEAIKVRFLTALFLISVPQFLMSSKMSRLQTATTLVMGVCPSVTRQKNKILTQGSRSSFVFGGFQLVMGIMAL